ncbi:hypothetical protein IG5_00200 [Bacillus toyonensis]|nr:hypothetical protein IG5_00200 [Bacillus toyonensis]
MFYMTVFKKELIIIPLVNSLYNLKIITDFFNIGSQNTIKDELIKLLINLKNQEPVKSVSPLSGQVGNSH